tara:strand:+ start:1396 stop:1911 length:516 start_codon:yes stop_codon:yes gene_type:complete
MLEIDLNQLKRDKTIVREVGVEPEEFDVSRFGFCLSSPISVNLKAYHANNEALTVKGSIETLVEQECRRCLKPVETKMMTKLDLHFTSKQAPQISEKIEEELQFDWSQGELDLMEYLFQEIVLNAPAFVECDQSCRGICAGCGTNLNKLKCDCPEKATDPRWNVLLKNSNK